MRLRTTLVCLSATVVAPFIATPAAHAAKCVGTSRTYYGTIQGADSRFVDSMLGFDILDRYGRKLDARPGSDTYGCPFSAGYSTTVRVNGDLPATGSTTTGTKAWRVTVPANATQMFIEAYAKGPGYTGTNQSRYGHAMRSKLSLPYAYSPIRIVLPVVCAVGGSTGGIHGYVSWKGTRTKADRAVAWSMAGDNNLPRPVLGWNMGTASDTGYYKIDNLQSNQIYVVRITKNGVTKQFTNVKVNRCGNTPLYANF